MWICLHDAQSFQKQLQAQSNAHAMEMTAMRQQIAALTARVEEVFNTKTRYSKDSMLQIRDLMAMREEFDLPIRIPSAGDQDDGFAVVSRKSSGKKGDGAGGVKKKKAVSQTSVGGIWREDGFLFLHCVLRGYIAARAGFDQICALPKHLMNVIRLFCNGESGCREPLSPSE